MWPLATSMSSCGWLKYIDVHFKIKNIDIRMIVMYELQRPYKLHKNETIYIDFDFILHLLSLAIKNTFDLFNTTKSFLMHVTHAIKKQLHMPIVNMHFSCRFTCQNLTIKSCGKNWGYVSFWLTKLMQVLCVIVTCFLSLPLQDMCQTKCCS